MQYALQRIEGRDFLVSASEVDSLFNHGASIKDAPLPDLDDITTSPIALVYGAFLPQRNLGAEEARDILIKSVNFWHGWIAGDTCKPVGLHAIEVFPQSGGLTRAFPIAAVIQARKELIDEIGGLKKHAATLFKRVADMDPGTNVFNRDGVLALKGVEKRIKASPLSIHNWKQSIDAKRAKRVAGSIR